MKYGTICPLYPYSRFKIGYLNQHKDGRRIIHLYNNESDRLTIAFARYLMSVHLGRFLLDEEHVDHINDNYLDDRIENYQILSPEQNALKSAILKSRELAWIACPSCGKIFAKDTRNTSLKPYRSGEVHCCSKSCSIRFQNQKFSDDVRHWFSTTQIFAIVRDYGNDSVYLTGINNNCFTDSGKFILSYPNLGGKNH